MADKILVVDDDMNLRKMLVTALSKHYDVVEAKSGEEALTLASQGDVRLVLLDIMMPGMDGLEAARRIRDSEPQCQVVLVSGSIFVDREEEGLEATRAAGASAYVVKSRAALDLADAVVSVTHASRPAHDSPISPIGRPQNIR